MSAALKMTDADRPAQVLDVFLADLQVDPSYQRGEKNHWKKIAAKWDPKAARTLLVAQRKDRSLWLVDGQQRRKAMLSLGILYWPANVVESSGPAFEAALYQTLNGGDGTVKHLTPSEMYKAQLVAGDPIALAGKRACEAAGLTLSLCGGSGWPRVTGLRTIYVATKVHGEDTVKAALLVISTAWPGLDDALDHAIIAAMVSLVANPAVDKVRLVRRLQTIPALQIRQETRGGGGGAKNALAYAALVRVYNKGLKNRLPERVCPRDSEIGESTPCQSKA